MKENTIVHNWTILFAIGLSMCSLGVSYAAAVDAGDVVNKISKTPDFIFTKEYEDDLKIYLLEGTIDENNMLLPVCKDTVQPLEAYSEHNYKTLNISGAEAFNLSDFTGGKVSFAVNYRMTGNKNREEASEAGTGVCDLGNIPFFFSGEEPYWRLGNHNGAWGIGTPDIGIPRKIYELLPDYIADLHGFNTITSYKNGMVRGTVTIGKLLSHTAETAEINLSSLELPDKINRGIIANGEKSSALEIMADYYFSAPLALNPKTDEDIPAVSDKAVFSDLFTDRLRIQGKITLKIRVKVIHDID